MDRLPIPRHGILQGWIDLVVVVTLCLPRLLGRITIVIVSAIATYLMLTRGYNG